MLLELKCPTPDVLDIARKALALSQQICSECTEQELPLIGELLKQVARQVCTRAATLPAIQWRLSASSGGASSAKPNKPKQRLGKKARQLLDDLGIKQL